MKREERHMETVKYELKYCEGCGTLKLRPVKSENTDCRRCESRLARFAFRHKGGARKSVALPNPVQLDTVAGGCLSGRIAGRLQ
jgi:ribosomal protein L37AE/L43A